jgi:hypothetical protein
MKQKKLPVAQRVGRKNRTAIGCVQILRFGHYLSSCLYLKHRLVYFSKHNVSETGFRLRFQVKPTQLGPIDRASPHLRTPVSLSRWGSWLVVSFFCSLACVIFVVVVVVVVLYAVFYCVEQSDWRTWIKSCGFRAIDPRKEGGGCWQSNLPVITAIIRAALLAETPVRMLTKSDRHKSQ